MKNDAVSEIKYSFDGLSSKLEMTKNESDIDGYEYFSVSSREKKMGH